MKFYRNIALTLICVILGVILAWQYTSINYNQQKADLEYKRLDELKDEIIKERQKVDELTKRNSELEKENQVFATTRAGDDQMVDNLKKELERAKIIAGLMDVKGKGVIVTIDNGESSTVEDSDILDVINELRASDAQAISVNDERIVATSEVRRAGRYIMVNRRQMLAPFVIKAIAEPDKVERALKMIGGQLEKLEGIYQLKVDVKASDNITIPKVRDDGTVLRYDLLTPVTQK